MAQVKGNPDVLFDDSRIAPYGQKLMGNHQFALAAGETGTALGYVSPGHNSALYEAATNQYFLVFHTRFPGRGEQHEVRVHELLFNELGWPVVAPLRYAPPGAGGSPESPVVSSTDAQGSYQYVDHGKDIAAAIKSSQTIRLNADGTISGAVGGTWQHEGNNLISIALGGGEGFDGVLSRQWNSNANRFVVTFSAQSRQGVSIWGVRTAD
jgi:arabinan endo-1,5-alpha-L-arabinosidase